MEKVKKTAKKHDQNVKSKIDNRLNPQNNLKGQLKLQNTRNNKSDQS